MTGQAGVAGSNSVARESQAVAAAPAEPRIVALDGFRGLMTLVVLVSHYFAEVAHPVHGIALGWVAVQAFFVLSGFLVGRLILERQDRANFFAVFYARRFCRTLPVYLVCVTLVFVSIQLFHNAAWLDVRAEFPLWSYLTFTQNFFFVATGSIGAHWLAPTWTLAVEEHFYLFAPALFFIVPRRHLMSALGAGLVLSTAFRAYVLHTGVLPEFATLVLLPGVADTLICGMMAALLLKSDRIDLSRYDLMLRATAPAMLAATVGLTLLGGVHRLPFMVFSELTLSIGIAAFLISVVRGAPEAKRLTSPVLCFFGRTSYSVYLTHLTVLGLAHGLILSSQPDLTTPAQWAITLGCLPISILVGWIGTKLVEEPITAYGRSWRWSKQRRPAATVPSGALAAA